MVRFQNVTKECCDNISKVRNNDVLLVRFYDVSKLPLVKHAATFWWCFTQERCKDVSKLPNHNISSKFQMKHPMKLWWHVCTTVSNLFCHDSPISMSLQRLQVMLPWLQLVGFILLSNHSLHQSSIIKWNTKVFYY